MIFIPKKNIMTINLDDNTENIFWKYNDDVVIVICHSKKDEFNSFVDEVCSFDSFKVLPCCELACSLKPQLRYNKIIKKYFCTCSSSMLGVKDTDEDELDYYKNEREIEQFNEKNGFYKNPLKAICHWQKMQKNMKGKY